MSRGCENEAHGHCVSHCANCDLTGLLALRALIPEVIERLEVLRALLPYVEHTGPVDAIIYKLREAGGR